MDESVSVLDDELLLQWFKIRDMFFGFNHVIQNIKLAVKLSAFCMHPKSKWMWHILRGVSSKNEAVNRLRNLQQKTAIGLCFLGCLLWDMGMLHEAAEMGDSLAYSFTPTEYYEMRPIGSPDTVFCSDKAKRLLFNDFDTRLACQVGVVENNLNYLERAARLNYYPAIFALFSQLQIVEKTGLKLCFWFCKTLTRGLKFYVRLPDLHSMIGSCRESKFIIGEAIYNAYDYEVYRHMTVEAVAIVDFYCTQCEMSKLAVDAFSLCGLRLHLYKDLRRLIGTYIWNNRRKGCYATL